MTDEERAALDWLEYGTKHWNDGSKRRAVTLKAMLAQPRLPETPDRMMLRIYACGGVVEPEATHADLYAHLTGAPPKPRTKQVWRVSYCTPEGHMDESEHDRHEAARQFAMRRLDMGCQGVGIIVDDVPA
jgi:hypothetical protein